MTHELAINLKTAARYTLGTMNAQIETVITATPEAYMAIAVHLAALAQA